MTKMLSKPIGILLIRAASLGTAHTAPPGPYLVKDIRSIGCSEPQYLTNVDGTLFRLR